MQNIDPAEIPSGSDYQWAAKAVCGDESLGDVARLKKGGWREVPALRHKGVVSENSKWIESGGLILMERPKLLSERSAKWERDKADAQIVEAVKGLAAPIDSPWASDVQANVFTTREINWGASPVRKTTAKEWFVRSWWTSRVWLRNLIMKEVKS